MFKLNSDNQRNSDKYANIFWKSGLLGQRLQISDEKISDLMLVPCDGPITKKNELEPKTKSKRKNSIESGKSAFDDDSVSSFKQINDTDETTKVSDSKSALIYQLTKNRQKLKM